MPQLQYIVGGVAAVALWVVLTINFSCRGVQLHEQCKVHGHSVPAIHRVQVSSSTQPLCNVADVLQRHALLLSGNRLHALRVTGRSLKEYVIDSLGENVDVFIAGTPLSLNDTSYIRKLFGFHLKQLVLQPQQVDDVSRKSVDSVTKR